MVSPGQIGSGGGPPQLNDLEEPQIMRLLEQVVALRAGNQLPAAVLVAWSALEAAMRRAAMANSIELRRADTLEVMRELVSNGILERQRYRDIGEVLRVRNAIAHGFATPETVDLRQVLDVIETSSRELLAEGDRPVEPPA